jgi:heterodisulfide reductase subunit D
MDIMYACNACGGCDVMCSGVHDMSPMNVILEMRAKMVEDGQILPQYMPIMDSLKKEDNTMMAKKADRGNWAEGLGIKNLADESAEVAFHVGCRISFDEDHWPVARGVVDILKEAGVDFGILGKEENCCGARSAQMGYQSELTKYAESNIDAWKNAGVKTVVTACSDGYYAMKRLYPGLGFKGEVIHITEFIGKLIADGKLKFKKELPMRVTYHDPCHLGRRLSQALEVFNPAERSMGVYDAPRDIINAIPGVELTEMFRNRECSWCCGAGGGVIDTYPEFNNYTATQRILEAKETGAEAIVTACPWCERSLRDAVEEMGDRMKVIDIVELVELARQ